MATAVLAHAIDGDTSVNPHVTPSFTPVAGELLVVFCCAVASVDTAPTCVASANGITFTRVHNQLWGGNDTAAIFVANQFVPASPVAMTVTYNTPADASGGGSVNVYRVAGMAAAGTAAVRKVGGVDQIAENANVTIGTAPSVNFPNGVSSTNPVLAQVHTSLNPPALTPPTGFTEDGETGWGSPTTGIELVRRNGGHSGTSLTWGSTVSTSTGVFAIELDAGGGVTPTVHNVWIGKMQATSQDIVSKIEGAGSDTVKIRYSVNSDMSGFSETTAVAPDARGVVKNSLSGLTANTKYYYKIVCGASVMNGGDFTTMPASGSFAFGFASCRNSDDDSNVFSDILTRTVNGRKARFFLQIGDLHYEDITTEDATLRRAAYDEFLSRTNIAIATRTLPFAYIYDDHDSVGNGAKRTDPGWTTTQSVYRERVPHFTLPQTTSAEQTFVIGRVRYIILDCRAHSDAPGAADGPSKTRLGATQKAWFINLLQTATEPLIFVVSSSPWIGPVAEAGGQDHWGMFPDERSALATEIAANGRVIILSGDQHCLALDDGTNSPGGAPVWHGAALNRSVTYKGGPYSHGQSTGGPHQYGFVDVADDGSTITATYRGILEDGSTWLTWTFNPSGVNGTATASLGGTAGATGVRRALGTAAASLGGTSAASGVRRALGTAAAALGFTGSATGVRRTSGSAGASLGGAASASGVRRVVGAAVASLGFTAAASGEAGDQPVTGTAGASLGGSATAGGVARKIAAATVSLGGTAAGTGLRRALGSAVASLGGGASASGTRRILSSAAASLGFTAHGNGLTLDPTPSVPVHLGTHREASLIGAHRQTGSIGTHKETT